MTIASPISRVSPLHSRRAPFLVWPVARREFYTAIAAALALPLIWGVLIFGFRALVLIFMTFAGAMLMHILLKHTTRRGRELVTAHTILSALVVAALADALWNPWLMGAAGMMTVALIWAFGGAGREKMHVCVLVALGLWLLLSPPQGQRELGSILARDRLFMGDLAQSGVARSSAWPRSFELSGQDAAQVRKPGEVVTNLLARISVITTPARQTGERTGDVLERVDRAVTDALSSNLPPLEMVILGVDPGPIGVVGGLGLILGGLYLAYRNILRPRSAALFLASAILGLFLSTFIMWNREHFFAPGTGGPWQFVGPAEMLTLLFYLLFSSDILMAATILLALPGTEPNTRRGRWWFIVFTGLTAGFLQRAHLPVPPATLAVAIFQPWAPLFDSAMGRKSWLNHAGHS